MLDKSAPQVTLDTDEARRELTQTPMDETQDPEPRSQVQAMACSDDGREDGNYEAPPDSDEPDEEYSFWSDDSDEIYELNGEEVDTEAHKYMEDRPVSLFTSLRVYNTADKFGVWVFRAIRACRLYL